jgi:hypothetical protein
MITVAISLVAEVLWRVKVAPLDEANKLPLLEENSRFEIVELDTVKFPDIRKTSAELAGLIHGQLKENSPSSPITKFLDVLLYSFASIKKISSPQGVMFPPVIVTFDEF